MRTGKGFGRRCDIPAAAGPRKQGLPGLHGEAALTRTPAHQTAAGSLLFAGVTSFAPLCHNCDGKWLQTHLVSCPKALLQAQRRGNAAQASQGHDGCKGCTTMYMGSELWGSSEPHNHNICAVQKCASLSPSPMRSPRMSASSMLWVVSTMARPTCNCTDGEPPANKGMFWGQALHAGVAMCKGGAPWLPG